jgi:inorganic pyrophosphatase
MATRTPTARLVLLLSVALLGLPAVLAAGGWVHPYDFPQSDRAPEEIRAVIEIPTGSFTKYELDPETGHLLVDRFVSMPVAYPANYGSITQSLAGDGDPLDVLVITREPLHPGVIVEVRPVAVLKALDDGEQDDKILAVPAHDVDPTYDDVNDVSDLPEMERRRIEAFFRVYKQIGSDKVIEIKGWGDDGKARKMVRRALEEYRRQHQAERAAP